MHFLRLALRAAGRAGLAGSAGTTARFLFFRSGGAGGETQCDDDSDKEEGEQFHARNVNLIAAKSERLLHGNLAAYVKRHIVQQRGTLLRSHLDLMDFAFAKAAACDWPFQAASHQFPAGYY